MYDSKPDIFDIGIITTTEVSEFCKNIQLLIAPLVGQAAVLVDAPKTFVSNAISVALKNVAVPLTLKEYDACALYRITNEQYESFIKRLKQLSEHESSERMFRFQSVLDLWKSTQPDIQHILYSKIQNMTGAGLGAMGTGASLVLGSTVGLCACALLMSGCAINHIWTSKTDTRKLTTLLDSVQKWST